MMSEERAEYFFDVFPVELPELRKAFIEHLDSHAAEQRELCASKCKIALYNWTAVTPNGTTSLVMDACINATGEKE